MSKNKIRKDKTCLNCRHVVDLKFCSNCGQENTDTRKTFHHLFLHFFEDLTHYENAFWRTIKNLLFKPAALTKEYLSGKRLSYLAPVRLYIFISFITFFLIAVLPDGKHENDVVKINKKETGNNNELTKEQKNIYQLYKEGRFTKTEADSLADYIKKIKLTEESSFSLNKKKYKSVKELDSIQKNGKSDEKLSAIKYFFVKKMMQNSYKLKREDFTDKISESFLHNFPKVIIIYMPIFAFFLWIFHNKKRWYYFDHGIFTLHYFSFLLLLFLTFTVIDEILFYIFGQNKFLDILSGFMGFITFSWMFYYFFPAHHRFYGETRWKSFFKSFTLFFINMFFITLLLSAFFIYTLISIH